MQALPNVKVLGSTIHMCASTTQQFFNYFQIIMPSGVKVYFIKFRCHIIIISVLIPNTQALVSIRSELRSSPRGSGQEMWSNNSPSYSTFVLTARYIRANIEQACSRSYVVASCTNLSNYCTAPGRC